MALVEFGDLQCPVCKGYSEEVLPQVIETQVRSGEAKLEFRNYTIIGPESMPAGAAAIAAGKQGRGWKFVELFYRNQGVEDSGYVTDEFLTAIAKGAGVPDIAKWNADRKSKRVLARSRRPPPKPNTSASPARRRSPSRAREPQALKPWGRLAPLGSSNRQSPAPAGDPRLSRHNLHYRALNRSDGECVPPNRALRCRKPAAS